MKIPLILTVSLLVSGSVLVIAQQKGKGKAKPRQLEWRVEKLHHDNNEGCAIGDIDGDGKLDITAGEYWYRAPEWEQLPVRKLMGFGADYLQNNAEHLFDMDGDGDLDIIGGQFTLPIVNWFENAGPGNYEGLWEVHQLLDTGTDRNEAAFFEDIDGDGEPEWYENSWNPKNPMQAIRLLRNEDGSVRTKKHVISEEGNGHGQGFGDINGDGLTDIVFMQGWYECPAGGPWSGPWKWRKDFTLPHASCPIIVTDLNGDGRNDLIWSDGHNYGTYWQEQLEPRADGTTLWRQHQIDKKFSQGHCLVWTDIDGDDQPELVTGKRYYAHSGNDPGAHDEITLHYYDFNSEAMTWKKNLISTAPAGEGPGSGLQIRTPDLDGDGDVDLVVAGKSGTHILWNEGWTQ